MGLLTSCAMPATRVANSELSASRSSAIRHSYRQAPACAASLPGRRAQRAGNSRPATPHRLYGARRRRASALCVPAAARAVAPAPADEDSPASPTPNRVIVLALAGERRSGARLHARRQRLGARRVRDGRRPRQRRNRRVRRQRSTAFAASATPSTSRRASSRGESPDWTILRARLRGADPRGLAGRHVPPRDPDARLGQRRRARAHARDRDRGAAGRHLGGHVRRLGQLLARLRRVRAPAAAEPATPWSTSPTPTSARSATRRSTASRRAASGSTTGPSRTSSSPATRSRFPSRAPSCCSPSAWRSSRGRFRRSARSDAG